MTAANKSKSKAAPLSNSRTIDVIVEEIHALERDNIIAVGKLLNELDEACEYGQWCELLSELDSPNWGI
jgi:hypothetical protein